MKFPTLSLRTITVLSLSLAGFSLANAAFAAGCEGVGNKGDYAKKLQERKGKGGEKTIGYDKATDLVTENKKIKKKLEACQSAVGNGLSIYNYRQVEERLIEAVKAHRQYINDQNEICQKYGQYTSDLEKDTNSFKDTADQRTQKDWFNKQAEIYRRSSGNFGSLEKYAGESGKKLQNGFPGNQKDNDPRMESAIKQFDENLQSQIKGLEDQARKKLADRTGQANEDIVVGKLRFRTQADVDRFYKGTDTCKEALADLKKFGEKYKKLSKDLGEAQQEAKDAQDAFKKKKDDLWKSTNEMQAEANKLNEGSESPQAISSSGEGGAGAGGGAEAGAGGPSDSEKASAMKDGSKIMQDAEYNKRAGSTMYDTTDKVLALRKWQPASGLAPVEQDGKVYNWYERNFNGKTQRVLIPMTH